MATGSVLKGSSVLIAGRLAGIAGSFLLFLLLTWRSREIAGAFRVAVTYFTIMDFLPLLGMQRWVAVEIARRIDRQYAIFELACMFAGAISVLSGVTYFVIACLGFYGPEISDSLKIVAFTTVASAMNLCTLSALVGLGYTHQAGLLSLFETLTRSILSILLAALGSSVVWIMFVFLITRYGIAVIGYTLVRSHVCGTLRGIDRGLRTAFFSQVPNLALSTVGFIATRNSALILLPLLRSESAAGLYAASFQLFDMAVMVPTVLTISANYIFVESSRQSVSALRRSTNQLIDITSLFLLPVSILGFVLAKPIVLTLFGTAFTDSIVPLRLLLASAVVVALDQILALSMAASGFYRADRTCMIFGGAMTVIATCLLSGRWGATGAATAFLIATTCVLVLRVRLLHWLVRAAPLANAVQHQTISAVIAGIVIWAALEAVEGDIPVMPAFGVIMGALGSALYCLILYWRGGLTRKRLRRAQAFMSKRS